MGNLVFVHSVLDFLLELVDHFIQLLLIADGVKRKRPLASRSRHTVEPSRAVKTVGRRI